MVGLLTYGMVYLGSALMALNIFQYVRFARSIREKGGWDRERHILGIPILLLTLFLAGYLAVGLFGRPDLIIASILFGGSVFVYCMLVLMRSVTDRIHEIEQMEAKVIAAEDASAAKSFFLSNMSHDMRTPLNAVIGYTTLAKNEDLTLDEAKRYLKKIDAAGHQLLEIVNDVLDMSRIESGKVTLEPDAMDIEAAVRETGELIGERMASRKIRFTVDCDVTHRWVLEDRGQLDRVLMNILGNACKFTDEGGAVVMSLRETGAEADMADYEIRVRDNGIGMSPDFARNIFTPFERERTSTVSRTQGTGLGMAITKKIVDLMGGDIQVHTKQGEGTEFIVNLRLPLVDAPEAAQEATAQAQGLAGLCVLLVDDNAVNREIARMILEQAGCAVDTAGDGKEAVDKVSCSRPGDFDLVLMDIQMPIMDGYAATKSIRGLANPALANIPIIAMTANAFKEDEQAAAEAGMQGHISKPLDVVRMMETIQAVMVLHST